MDEHVQQLYRDRFAEADRQRLDVTWRSLCRDFFQRWVPEDATVVDLAAGSGPFIRFIKAGRKIAVDVNPDVSLLEDSGVEVLEIRAQEMGKRLEHEVDVVFTSNFFEHLRSKEELLEVLAACRAALKPGGRLLVLQPNLRLVGGAYWDFFDHHLPITDRSLAEALKLAGFEVEVMHPRFLPYTSKSRLSVFASLTPLYVRLPLAWRIFGKQCFAVARSP
jgi:SAM-dependent methyltransferase